jgi:hypothetical protein
MQSASPPLRGLTVPEPSSDASDRIVETVRKNGCLKPSVIDFHVETRLGISSGAEKLAANDAIARHHKKICRPNYVAFHRNPSGRRALAGNLRLQSSIAYWMSRPLSA